jgi:hypothetical protein
MKISAPEAAEWLGLAAAPTLAAMALATAVASDGPMGALCGPAGGWLGDGMAVMYLLMSAFHVSPWLKRMGGRGDEPPRRATIDRGED